MAQAQADQTAPAQAEPAEAAQSAAVGSSDDILVTARRRDERVLDVPVAVSVLTADTLRANGVTTVLDIAKNVPAFQMVPQAQGKNSVAYTIRSQRQSEQAITQDGSVAAYFADVVMARTQGANGALFDLSSVQVLKGPQGTLFGRNTTGGAVLMTPQAPTDRFEGYLMAQAGNYDMQLLEGVVNLPIAEGLSVRAGGQINRRKGYVRNIFNGQRLEDTNTDSWRISVKMEPTDTVTNIFVINNFDVDENGAAPILEQAAPPATTRFPGLADALAASKAAGYYTTNSNDVAEAKIKSTLISNTTTWDVGTATVKNIFGYRFLNSSLQQDDDGSPFSIFPVYDFLRERQYSNELQLLGKALDGDLDYIIGGYYFREAGRETNGNAPLGAERRSIADVVNLSRSVFAQVSYKVVPTVSVTVGGRQTWDRRSITWQNLAGPYNGPYNCALTDGSGATLPVCERSASTNFSKFTYTASVDWHPTPNILVYATHRLGYRAGGYNLRSNTPVQSQPYFPEEVKDYEIGLKADWRAGGVRGRFSIAAYHQDYSDIQRLNSLIINGVFAGSVVQNAARAKIDGVEVDGMISPLPGLEFSGFFAYSNPRYTSYPETQANGTIIDIKNAPFAGAPKYSGGGAINYRYDAGDVGQFVANANVYVQSKTYGQDGAIFRDTLQPQPLSVVDGWTTTNARLEWNAIGGTQISGAFFVKNLFKERYDLSTLNLIDNGLGMVLKWRGEPRTWGGEVRVTF